ncbi:hypothetical protein ACLQ26_01730 [Micromonospora sp. DT43]|uniref:hypothetical protein n=1 Tax=Micromonospora sp. DT43 TaxID=3393440 RepID=UPI003CF46AE7
MNGVKAVEWDRESVTVHELERVARLRPDVHADDLEPCHVITHGGTARAAEQVEQSRPRHQSAPAPNDSNDDSNRVGRQHPKECGHG